MEADFLIINSRDELLRIDMTKVIYVEADGNYSNIVLANKLKATVGLNLGQVEKLFAQNFGIKARTYARIGKRYILNLSYLHKINVLRQQLILSDGASFAYQLDISKEALKNLKDLYVAKKSNDKEVETKSNEQYIKHYYACNKCNPWTPNRN